MVVKIDINVLNIQELILGANEDANWQKITNSWPQNEMKNSF